MAAGTRGLAPTTTIRERLTPGVNFSFVSRQGVIDDVHTFSPTPVLNVRYGYNRFIRIADQEPDAQGFDLTQARVSGFFQQPDPGVDETLPAF